MHPNETIIENNNNDDNYDHQLSSYHDDDDTGLIIQKSSDMIFTSSSSPSSNESSIIDVIENNMIELNIKNDDDNNDVDIDDDDDDDDNCYDNDNLLLNETNILSTNDVENFFEGAEKRLAIYFKNDFENKNLDLRKLTRSQWKNILDLVHCQILNIINNEQFDAYLLSESSLFVSKRSFILKTCGSTTLLHCLDLILDYVFKLGFNTIEDVFYSHKNLLIPSLQTIPHDSFLKENKYLNKLFNGHSHLFGHINADRWYLYLLDDHHEFITDSNDDDDNYDDDYNNINININNNNEYYKFEMIMEELDENVMRLFFNDNTQLSQTASEVTKKSGIDKIIPGMMIDDHLFTPCGYSMNGLLSNYYMTIHITPESEFSYVSLEMNVPQKSYIKFITKIIDIFKPGKFMLNLFVPNIMMMMNPSMISNKFIQNNMDNKNVNDDNDDDDGDNKYKKKLSTINKTSSTTTAAAAAAATTIPSTNGLVIYEILSCCKIDHYRRCDFQMAQTRNLDIIYARFVNEGIS